MMKILEISSFILLKGRLLDLNSGKVVCDFPVKYNVFK